MDRNLRNVGFLTVLAFVLCLGYVAQAERPAEFKNSLSLFFRDWTKSPLSADSIKPVMASDGYRLPVDANLTIGSISMSVNTQFLATDSSNRAVVIPTGTMNVNVMNSQSGSCKSCTIKKNSVLVSSSS